MAAITRALVQQVPGASGAASCGTAEAATSLCRLVSSMLSRVYVYLSGVAASLAGAVTGAMHEQLRTPQMGWVRKCRA